MAKKLCPKCGGKTKIRCQTDSDQRINSTWRVCEEFNCDYDQRTWLDIEQLNLPSATNLKERK